MKLGILSSGNLGKDILEKIILNFNVVFVLTDINSQGILSLCKDNKVPYFKGNPRNGIGYDFIKKIEVEGIAGGDLVKVILSGDYELKSIIISDIARKESQEIINDLIIAAYNNAKENLKKKSADELSKVTGGLNLPLDFKLPF